MRKAPDSSLCSIRRSHVPDGSVAKALLCLRPGGLPLLKICSMDIRSAGTGVLVLLSVCDGHPPITGIGTAGQQDSPSRYGMGTGRHDSTGVRKVKS